MLHPGLAGSDPPTSTFQIDTEDVGLLVALYNRNLAPLRGTDGYAGRLGLLWKKMAGSPRLARLLWRFCQLRGPGEYPEMEGKAAPRQAFRVVERVLAALGFASSPPRDGSAPPELQPLYDAWLDG